ncbi:MAG: hypothetical protein Q8T09_20270 [Candidatus Melainabacteria bacterium]|nr:hypothetical protein [Candidatus Melainabacteria bacterium]
MSDQEKDLQITTSNNSGTFTQAKQRLASHPEAKPEVLEKLSDKSNSDVVTRVAENAHATPSTLEKLSTHQSPEVRSAVTKNSNTSNQVLTALAHDENPDVRFELAGNAHTPVEILEVLKEDENPYVVDRAEKTLKSVKSVLETADALLISGDFIEAEATYKKLILTLETLIGAEHPEVAAARHKLAAALAGQNKIAESQAVENQAQITVDAIKEAKSDS